MKNTLTAKPFLKWAGGKGQLLEKFQDLYPEDLVKGNIDTYIEAFVGGGAVFFDVMQKYEIKKAFIIDINKELINCYRCIKEDVNEMIRILEKLSTEYKSIVDKKQKEEFFYEVRERYNSIKLNGKYDFEKAADFIFLNKTCFNGLYRVNKEGKFNVPHGNYKNPMICDNKNLSIINTLLQSVDILHGEYHLSESYIDKNTFLYFDPPYRPLLDNVSFVSYAKNGFTDVDQEKLADFYKKADKHGAKCMLSNSDPKNSNEEDDFFDNLYSEYKIERIMAKRMINCQADKRGNITEIVVKNY